MKIQYATHLTLYTVNTIFEYFHDSMNLYNADVLYLEHIYSETCLIRTVMGLRKSVLKRGVLIRQVDL